MRRSADWVSLPLAFRLPLLIDLADHSHPLFDLGVNLFVGALVAFAAPLGRRFDDVGHARTPLNLRMLTGDVDEFVCLSGLSDVLERDGFRLNQHRALDLWWSMNFSENRYPLFRIML